MGPSFEKQRITLEANHHPLFDLFDEINYVSNFLCVPHAYKKNRAQFQLPSLEYEMKQNKEKGVAF